MKFIKAIIYSFFNLFFYFPVGMGIAFSMPFIEKFPILFFIGFPVYLYASFLPIYVAILSANGIKWKSANLFQKISILLFVLPATFLWIFMFIH